MIRESLTGYVDRGHQSMSIDLSQVDYIDGNGIKALVFLHTRAKENYSHVGIKGLRGSIRELFELAQLDKVLDIQ